MTEPASSKPKKNIQSVHRASTSMPENEIEALDIMLTALRSGKDMRVLARSYSKELSGVAQKLERMKTSMKKRQNGGARGPQ